MMADAALEFALLSGNANSLRTTDVNAKTGHCTGSYTELHVPDPSALDG